MAGLYDIHHYGLLPSEEEEADDAAAEHSEAQPPVEGHDDEHEAVGDDDLHDVQQRLQHVQRVREAALFTRRLDDARGDAAALLLALQLVRLADALQEQILAVVLEALVHGREQHDAQHGAHERREAGYAPPGEEHGLAVASVERRRVRHVRVADSVVVGVQAVVRAHVAVRLVVVLLVHFVKYLLREKHTQLRYCRSPNVAYRPKIFVVSAKILFFDVYNY